ncbi:hypothetical protein D5400_14055 [Georhizobium profundi]|uniref:DUF2163 domain-containing protein n=1 Tax=Georhizobium profundi TaxID=2341112 RepID=A0A3S9B5P7_9HYPH|nr:hypothetical protein [Georhizobium profundi]AZN72250.1 hypothetical protein D5400_14055 [Georhizobium profundi]
MRSVSPEVQAALQARRLVARDFLWIVARDRQTGELVPDGNWSGVGNVSAEIIHPLTGLVESRDWYGSGTLIQISDIPAVNTLSVQAVTIRMSQVVDRVQDLVRGYDIKQAPVEIYRGLFNPDTRQLVAPAFCRFIGFVDVVEINTPAENAEGSVDLRCVSHTQELTRASTETRSHESQKLRDPEDEFCLDASTAGEFEIFWGTVKGRVPSAPKRKKFLGIF